MTVPLGLLGARSHAPIFNPLPFASPLKTLWAADPAQTTPGANATASTWKNSGSITGNWSAALGSAVGPTYRPAVPVLNNQAAVEFAPGRSTGTSLDVPSFTTVTQPFSFILVFAHHLPVPFGTVIDTHDSSNPVAIYNNGGGNQFHAETINSGTDRLGPTEDTNPHLEVIVFNGSSTIWTIDGNTAGTGSPGGNSIASIRLAASRNGGPSDVGCNYYLGFFGFYAGDVTVNADFATLTAGLKSLYGTP